jgi:2-amino-4-hydroxy-6-hydroxymethyldihydropteridine diphosphokinase
MAITYLIAGGNLGDRELLLESANESLKKKVGTILFQSAVYESKAWGFASNERFLNQVSVLETQHSPFALLELIGDIEKSLGRSRIPAEGYTSRTMDIDILFYDNEKVQTGQLIIPHPRLHLRRFVLEPLMEVNDALIHPVYYKTIWQLYRECPDPDMSKKFV